MSNVASTIPAKRNLYLAKTTKIPSLDDYKPRKDKPRQDTKAKRRDMNNNADVLIIKHKETNKTDTLQDGSDSNHFDNQESWMTKTKDALESGLDKINPLTTGYTRHRKGLKQSGNHLSNEPNKPTIKILNTHQYEEFMEEREHILGLNEKYEKRIAELEQETSRVLGEFAKLYEDNKKLRRKMDTGKDPLLEPYSRVFEDRKILREAEGGYKKRIIRLEQEIIEKKNESDKFQDEVMSLRARIKPTSKAEEKEKRTKEMKLKEELKKVKTENETLKNDISEFLNVKLELKRMKDENDTLRNIIKKLEQQTSNNPDENVRSTGTLGDLSKQPKESKLYQVRFENKPYTFDYEYFLPDSQIYD